MGSIVLGMGFVLEPEEARRLIDKNPRNKDVLSPLPQWRRPQLTARPVAKPVGHQLLRLAASSNGPDRLPWTGRSDYPDCLRSSRRRSSQIGRQVTDTQEVHREKWWQFAERVLANSTGRSPGCEQVLVNGIRQVTRFVTICVPAEVGFFNDQTSVVFIDCTSELFASLQSCNVHLCLGVELRCQPRDTTSGTHSSDCFETFPFPRASAG